MPYKIGEKVLFLHEKGTGIVKKIQKEIVIVEDETGFERPFLPTDLVKIHGTTYYTPTEDPDLIHKQEIRRKDEKPHHIRKYPTYWEIDLHIDDLVDHYGDRFLSKEDQALIKQLAVFKEFYYTARDKKVRKLIIIHGFGKGILRSEIQIFLKGQEGVDFWDAPYTEYGHGAIQVEIKYKY